MKIGKEIDTNMNNEKIKHKNPFLGEVELEPVGKIIIDAFFNTETYFIHSEERFKKRGLDNGAYVRNNQTGEITFIQGRQIEMITKIYDKLTRLDINMDNEKYNQIIEEAYVNYKKYIDTQQNIQRKEVQRLRSEGKRVRVTLIKLLSKEEFINKCKTDSEFSEKWGLKIEERELSYEERRKKYKEFYNVSDRIYPDEKWMEENNIPTKLITITYNNEKIESYE